MNLDRVPAGTDVPNDCNVVIEIPLHGDPIDKLSSLYRSVPSPRNLPEIQTQQIAHFFERYKDLEPGKCVRVGSRVGAEDAMKEIVEAVARYRADGRNL